MGRKRSHSARFRVGKVTGYLHHGAWWLYYREDGKTVRRKVALNRDDAEKLAAQINGQAAAGTPTLLSFDSIGVAELRKQFLEYHELALKSSMGTVRRYRAATQHLEDFVAQQPKALQAHQVRPGQFATYLRKIEVAPNGHKNTAKRKLRDKGVQFILETCRSMYTFALKNRHLPPYTGNPFSELPLDRLKIEDAKPIFVFTADTELAFFKSASEPGSHEAERWRPSNANAVWAAGSNSFARATPSAQDPNQQDARTAADATEENECSIQCQILRDIFGLHFGPTGGEGIWLPVGPSTGLPGQQEEQWCRLPTPLQVYVAPEWLSWNVANLA